MDSEEVLTDEQWRAYISAGATVRHKSPFSYLPTPLNDTPMSQEMRQEWVIPFYRVPLRMLGPDFTLACARATPELTRFLLSEFNWRPRLVAARFIAIRQFFELQQEMSNLLLKSEVCCVGGEYCLALASLGNEAAADTLATYLDYYLRQPDLWFDQGDALAALIYLDEIRGSNKAASFMELWQQFISDKPNWNLDNNLKWLRIDIAVIQNIRQRIATTTC